MAADDLDLARALGEALPEELRRLEAVRLAALDGKGAAPAEPSEEPGDPGYRVVPKPSDPMRVTRMFLDEEFKNPNSRREVWLLRHHRGGFYAYDKSCWPELDERLVRSRLYGWLERAVYEKQKGAGVVLVPFEPNRYKVADGIDALQAHVHLPQSVVAPAWLNDDAVQPASEVVSLANGLLHIPSRTLSSHTPDFFVQHSLPFEYRPRAARPRLWLKFLAELWGEDEGSIKALQEIFGYILSGSTKQQKLFMIIGPKRSGKGTIGRVLTGLIGPHNTAGPTLSGLTQNFGLQPLIDKPLAIISDARLSNRAEGSVAVERLLSISGEDLLTVDRKYREPWTGRVPARFLILTNELPRMVDSSGALASRVILLVLSKSFFGQEDPLLTDKLLAEAPGIFNWAMEGLDRLNERGHFIQPGASLEAIQHLNDLSSPVSAFVRDRCQVAPGLEVEKDVLFKGWNSGPRRRATVAPGRRRSSHATSAPPSPASSRSVSAAARPAVRSSGGSTCWHNNQRDPWLPLVSVPKDQGSPGVASTVAASQDGKSEWDVLVEEFRDG